MNASVASQDSISTTQGLTEVLVQTYRLFHLAQGYHWTADHFGFQMLKPEIEAQYTDLFQAIDRLSSRLRALGGKAPGGLADVARLSSQDDAEGSAREAKAIIGDLLDGHSQVCDTLQRAARCADACADRVTAGLLTDRIASHEKTMWMLRSLPDA